MESSDSPSSSSMTAASEVRPQAGPLPSKRGEIGYTEGIHGTTEEGSGRERNAEDGTLPARHPADRDAPPSIEVEGASAPSSGRNTNGPPANPRPSTPASSIATSSTASAGKRSIIAKLPHIWGISLWTLFVITLQTLIMGGTLAAWVFTAKTVARHSTPSPPTNDQGNQQQFTTGSSAIFIHVVFAVAMIGQLLLFERRLFRLRAERYGYLHPGEMLPRHIRNRNSTGAEMGFAPWNRPPLPTYAATLAASGHGTGDVEDHIIAAPPPPAYGNTRGSTLLLSGFLRDSLRAQRPNSVHSVNSHRGRPLSYMSRDEQWVEVVDSQTHRMTEVERTLARLEDGHAPISVPQQAVLRS